MLIHLEKLGKTFGEKVVLHDVTASVEREDRIGIVGQNGAGKTTLLKILTGEYQDYEGEFSVTHGVTLGYLEQNAKLDATLDIYGEMRATFAPVLDAMAQMQILERRMAAQPDNADLLAQHDALQNIVDAADGYNMDVNIKKVLSGMGFAQDTWQKNIAVLSGGELTRLRLAKLLLEKPDVLILDEPTNHLDFATMEWLENYLKGYSGAVLVVSHDRYFLDNVCTKIWEVSFQTMTTYKGNFSAYLPQKEAADALRQKQHDADVALAEKLQDYVDRNLVRASTTKMAQSRRRQLEKLEITEAPKDETNQLKFRFEYDVEPWNELVMLKNLSIKIGERTLLEPFTYTVCRGQRLIIAGPNGAGKSTLMQVLDGKRRPSGGMVRLGTGARPSIFAQQQNRLGQGRVIDAIWNKYPRMTELEVHSHLAKLGFRGDTVFKPCEALSGGELARLRFAEIVLERPNLLFLDEPTNHLDAESILWLEHFLHNYQGAVLAVTHDRYFLDNVAEWICEVDRGHLYPYKGNYSTYLETKAARIEAQGNRDAKLAKRMEAELEWVRSSPKARQAKNKARLERYNQMENEARNNKKLDFSEIQIPAGPRLGSTVLEANHIHKAFGERVLIDDLSFTLPRNGIVGVIGPNGVGKSTLFKTIVGLEPLTSGELKIGDTVKISYVDQNREGLDPNKNLWEAVSGGLDFIEVAGVEVPTRAYVASFGFKGADQQKLTGVLSGGERNRLNLALTLKQGGNLLLLDEPTNDLDVETLESLENALLEFPGCAVVISHDRWFLDRVATHILAWEGDDDNPAKWYWFEGNFQAYQENKVTRLGEDAARPHRLHKKLVRG